ncbi:response regulator transcription factor [Dehalococcoidales bacterium]|nr:response regulator transcription factor [Dehalococcoidales bacterium]MCL0057864.1 response regulator transcription factor [Dehalococcoidales bacterium]
MAKVLIIEDDRTLLDVLRYNLSKEGYHVVTAIDGVQGLEVARSDHPDLIILDIMLPEISGFEVCRILRKEFTIPILMLTAKGEEIDRVVGLELGADDYITKPFSLRELLARVRAMLRRVEMMKQKANQETLSIKVGNLEVNFAHHQVLRGGAVVDLSPKEFELLAFLIKNRGRVFSRDHLLEKVWGYDYAGDTRTVDVHIRWLRQKIEPNPSQPSHILTVPGVGYKFSDVS